MTITIMPRPRKLFIKAAREAREWMRGALDERRGAIRRRLAFSSPRRSGSRSSLRGNLLIERRSLLRSFIRRMTTITSKMIHTMPRSLNLQSSLGASGKVGNVGVVAALGEKRERYRCIENEMRDQFFRYR